MSLIPQLEKNFTLHGFDYAVQCWGNPADPPMLALHGWLDNSESFSVLAEYLKGFYLVVPDLAGHGLSHQRLGFAEYSLWSETNELCAIADALGLQKFTLIGHSRGAMMAHIIAAIVPDRIARLILLDAITPPPVNSPQILPRLRRRHQEITKLANITRYFTDKASAIRARCQSEYGGISQENAERLAKRGVTEKNGQFFWHADSKLKIPSGTGLTADQIIDLLSHAIAPTLALMADQGLMYKQENTPAAILADNVIQARDIIVKTLKSDHFLHMNESAKDVATEIMAFIQNESEAIHAKN